MNYLISKVHNFYLFADDTNIYYESDTLQHLEKIINKELTKLYGEMSIVYHSILIKLII